MARIEPGRGTLPVTGADDFSVLNELRVLGKILNPSGSLILSASTHISGALSLQDYSNFDARYTLSSTNGFVFVSEYCACDGVTDDTSALQEVVDTGKTVIFPRDSTLLISSCITLVAGQRVIGNSSILKRANQVTTTTTTSISSGVTNQITVADASGFRVGQYINVINGSTYDQSNRLISNIVGNVITTSTTWGVSVTGTTTIYTSYYALVTVGNNVIENLKINGNRDNALYGRWESTREVHMTGDNDVIRGCEIYECEGETIMLSSDWQVVEDCYVHDANGTAVHFSGCTHPIVRGLTAVRCNQDENTTVGHNYGAVEWSNLAVDVTCTECFVSASLAGFSNFLASDSSSRLISNSIVRDCTYGVYAIAGTTGSCSKDIQLLDSKFYNSPLVISHTQASTTAFPENWIMKGNYFENSTISLTRVRKMIFEGNQSVLNSGSIHLNLNYCQNLLINGNQFFSGTRATFIGDGEGATSNIVFSNNSFLNQTAYGCQIGANTFVSGSLIIQNNVIANSASADSAYIGISVSSTGKVKVFGNTIQLVKGDSGITCGNNMVVQNNLISGSTTYSIRTFGGSSGIVILGNQVNKAVTNGGGDSNLVDDNDVITTL